MLRIFIHVIDEEIKDVFFNEKIRPISGKVKYIDLVRKNKTNKTKENLLPKEILTYFSEDSVKALINILNRYNIEKDVQEGILEKIINYISD